MPTQKEIDNAGDVIWGVAAVIDELDSPFAEQLRDAWIVLKQAAVPEPELPPMFYSPSPNHGGLRQTTAGIIWHSTRGGAATPAIEFDATLRWFNNPNSQVSAHYVIGHDRWAQVVQDQYVAWHAKSYNVDCIGIELVQCKLGDPITDMQYRMARQLVKQLEAKYGKLWHKEHREVDPQKSDVGVPFDLSRIVG